MDETLAEVVEPIIYAEALDLIELHRAAGRRVYIISASPAEIVAPLGRFLGVLTGGQGRPRAQLR